MKGKNVMRDLQMYARICLKEVESAGIEHGHIERFEINTRAVKRLGQCRRKNNRVFTINISHFLLDERVPELELKDTLIHEILHTCEGCFDHKSEWKRMAAIMNRKYGYHVSRTSNCEEWRSLVRENNQPKYIVKCQECGATWKRMRKCNLVDHPERYRCRCGGHLERIE